MRPEYERLHQVDTVQCIWQQPAPHMRDFEDSSIMNLQLGRSMETMYQRMEFADASIVVEGQTLRAHRAVLAAASPVFACMFRSNMQEGQCFSHTTAFCSDAVWLTRSVHHWQHVCLFSMYKQHVTHVDICTTAAHIRACLQLQRLSPDPAHAFVKLSASPSICKQDLLRQCH